MFDFEFIILLFGVVLTVSGIVLYKKGQHLMNFGEKAQGIIYKLEKRNGVDYSALYYPVVRFKTKDLEWITHELDFGTNPPLYQEGEKIIIIYDPDDPAQLDVFSPFKLKVLPWILSGSGIILLIIGALKVLDVI